MHIALSKAHFYHEPWPSSITPKSHSLFTFACFATFWNLDLMRSSDPYRLRQDLTRRRNPAWLRKSLILVHVAQQKMGLQQPPPQFASGLEATNALFKPSPDLIKHRVTPLTRAMRAQVQKNHLAWHKWTNHQAMIGYLHGIANVDMVHPFRRRGQA